MFDYPVTLTPDDGTVLVTFADVPEAITFGVDEDEALLHAVEAGSAERAQLLNYIRTRPLKPR